MGKKKEQLDRFHLLELKKKCFFILIIILLFYWAATSEFLTY